MTGDNLLSKIAGTKANPETLHERSAVTEADQNELPITFAPDEDETSLNGKFSAEPKAWNILIVDDDVDVHVVTKFSLRDATYKHRPLNFLHAYSGKEGYKVLKNTPDIACVLLDVVMETDHAGLDLAREIRGEINNQLVRIVLRTGQSGQALEQSIIVDYDVNDYRTKSELTSQKLFTTIITALRAYDSLLIAHRSTEAFLRAQNKIKELRTALDHHSIFSITDVTGIVIHVNEQFCKLSGYTREELIGKNHRILNSEVHPKSYFQEMWKTIVSGQSWQGVFQNRAKDGSIYCLETSIIPVLDLQGSPTQYLAAYTEQKIAVN